MVRNVLGFNKLTKGKGLHPRQLEGQLILAKMGKWKFWIISLLVLALAGTAIAQDRPPRPAPMNPPAHPAHSHTGSGRFAPIFSAPLINPSFTLPNNRTWTALGPAPLNQGVEGSGSASGRITGVAVDPTNSLNVYVAAAGGGVWHSTDGGNTYTPLTDTQDTLSMGAIAIAPTNHLKIYAGTGEANNSSDSNFGLGILVSNDGGATWTLSTGPSGVFDKLAVSKISVDPTDANTAYAAFNDFAEHGHCCSFTGIYKTSDGGITWTNVTSAVGLDSSFPWSDVVVDPNNHVIVYAAHGDPFGDNAANGIYRSTDGGAHWSLLSGAPSGSGIGRIALAVAASASTANQHVLYAAVANPIFPGATLFEMAVSKNADSATPTFANLTSTPNFGGSGAQGWYDWVIAVDPANANNVYAAGALDYNTNSHHVIRTTDGGTTWSDITTVGGIEPHTDSHAMAFDSSGRLLLGNDGGIWRFDPAGPSWTNLNGNLNTIQFTGIGIHPTSTQTILGGSQDNGSELSNGSTTWTEVEGGDGGYSQISQTAPMICYTNHPIGSFGPTGFFRVSTDGCNTFSARTPSISDESLFNFYAPIFVDPTDGNRAFLGGDALYETLNAGIGWAAHTNPAGTPIDSIAVFPGGNTIYISTGGTFAATSLIWVSINDGASWTQHSLPVSGRVQEVDIDPNDSTGNTAVAVINTFNAPNGQVYRTTDGGTSWTNISGSGGTAVPAVPTWSAKIDTDSNHTIYVSNETGVYSSPSPYGTWTAVGTGLPHAQGVHLELNSNLHELALATHGRGAWFISTVAALASPTIAKAFNPTTIQSGGSSVVTLTLTNSNASALSGGAFTDTLVNMSAEGGAVGGSCGATPSSLSAGQTSLSFTGITIPASGNCTVIFSVTSNTVGGQPNTTSGVTTTQTPTAGSASNTATLTVTTIAVVTNITSSIANGAYKAGAIIPIQVTFSKIVNVTGTPQLALNSGGTASYTSGTGTSTLTFTYTVAAGQNSSHLDYTSTSALSLNGGTINDSGSTPANLTLPPPGASGSLGANKNIVIDTVAPTVVSYSVLFGTQRFNMIGSTRNRLPWQITGIQVVFSEAVRATTASLTGLSATSISGSGTNTVTWTISPVTNLSSTHTRVLGTSANAVTDLAGNQLGGGTDYTQTLKVLYGDFNDDGIVNSQDLVGVNAERSQAYNIFADINGDGVVDAKDVNAVRFQLGNSNP